jgi:hypothetical protein
MQKLGLSTSCRLKDRFTKWTHKVNCRWPKMRLDKVI